MTKNFKIEEENMMVENEQADKKLNKNFEVLEDKEIEKQNNFDEVLKFEAYGGFWRRLAAHILSYISIYVLLLPFVWRNFTFFLGWGGFKSEFDLILFFIIIIIVTANIIYNIYYYFKEGKTLGYKILGMQIVSQKTGRLPRKSSLIGRWILKTLLTGAPYIGIIGSLITAVIIGVNKKKKAPHDMIGKTLVVVNEKNKNNWAMWIVLILIALTVLFFVYFVISAIINDTMGMQGLMNELSNTDANNLMIDVAENL